MNERQLQVAREFDNALGRSPELLAAGCTMPQADLIEERAKECIGLLRYLGQLATANGITPATLISTYHAVNLAEQIAGLSDRLHDEGITVGVTNIDD